MATDLSQPSSPKSPLPGVGPAQLLGRSALPLLMLGILLGTPLYGGYVTAVLALILWRSAGILL